MSTEHAHDDHNRDTGQARQAVQRDDAQHAAATSAAARTPASLARFSAATVSRLQRSVGSRAISRALTGEGLAVQRHSEGEALPAGEQDAAEVAQATTASAQPAPMPAGQAPTAGVAGAEEATAPATQAPPEEVPAEESTAESAPAETRTAEEETTQKAAGTKAGGEYEAAYKLSPGAQSLASAQQVLQGAYGGMKTFVSGTIEILADQAACSAKYDEVCIRDGVKRPDGSAWKAGDKAKDDIAKGVRVQGFAWKGVVYVNGKTTLVTATAHEMLHVNVSADFRKTVGETINEGATEYFARKALKASGVTVPATTAYPKQVKITEDLIALVGEDALQKAYFSDVQELVKAYEAKGSKTFAELKTAAEALDATKVADALKPKPPYNPTEI